MKRYDIDISPIARQDINDLSDAIMYQYKSFNTAIKYIDGLFDEMKSLRFAAESLQPQTQPYYQRYGLFVYRVNYKKMAIIYTVHNRLVVIERVVPASLITDL